jgi:hypothetical protein
VSRAEKPSEPTSEALLPCPYCNPDRLDPECSYCLGTGRWPTRSKGSPMSNSSMSDALLRRDEHIAALKARVAELEGQRDDAITEHAGYVGNLARLLWPDSHEEYDESHVAQEVHALCERADKALARVAELEGLNASLTEDVADLQREKNNAGALAMEYMRERDDARKDARVREETIETLRASLAKRNTELLGTEAQLATVTRERGLAESRIVNAARVVENWSNRANEMEARAERLEQALRNIADPGAWGYVDDSGCPKPYGREAWIGDSHPIDIATAALSAPPSGGSASTDSVADATEGGGR